MVAATAHAGDVTPRGGQASSTSDAAAAGSVSKSWPTRQAGRHAALANASRLSDVQDSLGRGPDRSDQGGACGGIVLHDWHEENLRVITLGDTVQSIAPLVDDSRR